MAEKVVLPIATVGRGRNIAGILNLPDIALKGLRAYINTKIYNYCAC